MILKRAIASCLLAAACLPAQAREIIIPAAPQVGGKAHVLMDHDSGKIISESRADESFPPASLTKIMTAYVVASEQAQGKFSMQDKVPISERAWRMGGSKMFVEVDDKVPLVDLLNGVAIQSGNDASVALAEFVAGDEGAFADLMNGYAQRLGMRHSHFVNATGLPNENHYSSAGDMAILAHRLIKDFPDIYAMHAVKEFSYGGITQKNRNGLLWRDESVDGIKTGHTEAAGYCLAASAKRGDMRLISVVMGFDSERAREEAAAALLNYGFRFYETALLRRAHAPLETASVWKGYGDAVRLGLAEDLVLTFPRGARDDLRFEAVLDQEVIVAPIEQGQRLGVLKISYAGDLLETRPLVALHGVAQGSLYRRAVDAVRLWFR